MAQEAQDAQQGQPAETADQNQQEQVPEDVDLRELYEAEEAARRELEGETSDSGDTGASAAPDAQQGNTGQDGQGADQPQADEQPMVPKARLDQELERRRRLEEERRKMEQAAAYWRGKAEVAPASSGQGNGGGQQAQQQPQRSAKDVQADLDQLYDQFDSGELSLKELRRQEEQLNQERQKLHAQQQPNQEAPEEGSQKSQDLYLEHLTAQLEQQNPWLDNLSDGFIESLIPTARYFAEQNGEHIGNDPLGDYNLRRYVVAAARPFGDASFGTGQQDGQQSGQQPGQSQQQSKQPRKQPTTQERQTKAKQAAQHPPDPKDVGSAAPSDSYSEDRLANMSEEELNQLPSSVLERIAPSKPQ